MTPDAFYETVLPRIANAWDERCFCANPAFRKLLSFNFRDYNIGPVALMDSEILIDAIIRKRFTQNGEPKSYQGEITQVGTCPQCNTTCTELYAEFSISMYQSSVRFADSQILAEKCLYTLGFRGFEHSEFQKIHDFQKASTPDDFVHQLIGR